MSGERKAWTVGDLQKALAGADPATRLLADDNDRSCLSG